jgi:hypothetical protein
VRPRLPFLPAATLALAALIGAGAPRASLAQEPSPAPIDPDALARFVPADGLSVYIEFLGLDAYPDAWDATSASKVLSQTKTGAMLAEILKQVVDQAAPRGPDGPKLTGDDANALATHLFHRGFVVGIAPQPGKPKPATVVVFRDAFDPSIRSALVRFLGASGMTAPGMKLVDKPGGRRVALDPNDPDSGWWVEGGKHLVIADRVDAVIAGIGGDATAATLPLRKELLAEGSGFRPVGVAFADLKRLLPPGTAPATLAGFESVERLDYRWGFEGPYLRKELRVVAPAPRKGLAAVMDQPAFTIEDLPPLPANLTGFTVAAVEPDQVYAQIEAVATAMGGPEAAKAFDRAEAAVKKATRKDLRADILSQIGPRVAVYTLPEKGGVSGMLSSVTPKVGLQVPKFAAFVELKDPKRFGGTIAELIGVLNEQLEALTAAGGAAPAGGRKPQAPEFRMTSPEPPTWILSLPPQLAALTNAKLTIVLGKRHLIVASAPDLARDALALEGKSEGRWAPTGALGQAIEGLPGKTIFLQVSDPSDALPPKVAQLPETVQQILALLATSASARAPGAMAGAGGAPGAAGAGGGPGPITEGGGRRGPQGASAGGGSPGPITEGGGRRGPQGASTGGPGPGQPPPGGPGLPGAPGQPPGGGAAPPAGGANPFAALAGVQINIPEDKKPDAKSIRAFLAPGAAVATVDDLGLTLISRESFPDVSDSGSLGLSSLLTRGALARPPAAGSNPPGGPGAPAGRPGQPGPGAGGSPGAARP